MTLPLPVHDGSNLQQILDLLAQAFIDTGGRQIKMRYGSSSVAFSASSDSTQTTVPHGMGSTPVAVFLTYKNPGAGRVNFYSSAAPDGTNIYVSAFQTQATAVTATVNFYWIAVG